MVDASKKHKTKAADVPAPSGGSGAPKAAPIHGFRRLVGIPDGASSGGWASDMMCRLKDTSVAELREIFREDLGRPEWAAHKRQYFDLLHGGLAELLESVRGKDQDLQQMVAYYTAHTLEAEVSLTTSDAAIVASGRLPDGRVLPEDRLLNALASLLDDAKGKDKSHQLAMVNATASITESVSRIKELRHSSEAVLGRLSSPVTPKHLGGAGDAITKTK